MIPKQWRSCLRHCATSLNVAGSIPDGVTGILTYMILPVHLECNRNKCQEYFLGGKGGPCVRLIILPHSCADCV